MSRVIFTYTREQALADGVLVDVTQMAREAGIRHPTALTAAAWAKYVGVPPDVAGQDERGRLWDVLCCFRWAAAHCRRDVNDILFKVAVQNRAAGSPESVQFKAHCGPGDNAEPVLTIMLPQED